MRLVTIADVFQLEHNETIPSIKGKIIEINKQSKGTNDHGDWTLQNLTLQDASGVVKVKLNGRDELPTIWKGKTIYISCYDGEKGLSGIKAKDDDYRGKVTRIVSVTKTADITEEGNDGPSPDPRNEPAKPAAKSAPQPEPKQTTPTTPPVEQQTTNGHATSNGVGEAKKTLNRMANLYLCCLEAGQYVRHQWKTQHGAEMTDEQFQSSVSCLFIQANRENLWTSMPTGVLK